MNKIFATLLAVAAFSLTSAQAQSSYAKSSDTASLVAYAHTNATTVTTNLTRDAFRLSAVPGGQSILGWSGICTSGTNSTHTNAVTVYLATSLGDPTLGPWYTNATFRFDNSKGTNGSYTVGETNLGSAQWARIVKLSVAGTNLSLGDGGQFITVRLGQHR